MGHYFYPSQGALREKKTGSVHSAPKKNPLKNINEMAKLNPFAIAQKRVSLNDEVKNRAAKDIKRPVEESSAKPSKKARITALKDAEDKRIAAKEEAAAKRLKEKDLAKASKEAAATERAKRDEEA